MKDASRSRRRLSRPLKAMLTSITDGGSACVRRSRLAGEPDLSFGPEVAESSHSPASRAFCVGPQRGKVHLAARDIFCRTGFSREGASPGTPITATSRGKASRLKPVPQVSVAQGSSDCTGHLLWDRLQPGRGRRDRATRPRSNGFWLFLRRAPEQAGARRCCSGSCFLLPRMRRASRSVPR
jgi:hypothetical protein